MNHPILSTWLLSCKNKNINFPLCQILTQIATICKTISYKISRASLDGLTGYSSNNITNYHGEQVKTLDIVSNELFLHTLKENSNIYALISEENDHIIKCNPNGEYIIAFDPLDGSSNIDANINIGSIFSIFKRISNDNSHETLFKNCLRSGSDLIVGGYCLYGTSTIFMIALNKDEQSVNGFTLDNNIGEYLLTYPNIKIPKDGNIYSVNEGNYKLWDDDTKTLIDKFKSDKGYTSRYIGSMVADVHRTLLYGGIFMYPVATNAPKGKLRYLYEVAPMSLIIEIAGGKSIINDKSALDYKPLSIHERTPIILGSINML